MKMLFRFISLLLLCYMVRSFDYFITPYSGATFATYSPITIRWDNGSVDAGPLKFFACKIDGARAAATDMSLSVQDSLQTYETNVILDMLNPTDHYKICAQQENSPYNKWMSEIITIHNTQEKHLADYYYYLAIPSGLILIMVIYVIVLRIQLSKARKDMSNSMAPMAMGMNQFSGSYGAY